LLIVAAIGNEVKASETPRIIVFDNTYRNKKVLITGNTGFKGSWLACWLLELGAEVVGFADDIPTHPSHHELLALEYETIAGDIRCHTAIERTVENIRPDIIFHLAAQPITRKSYREPLTTFSTNVMGTANLLEAVRHTGAVGAIIIVSSDKCYENREWEWGYRETDALGGSDPYSASKGCTELVTTSYRRSFFPPETYGREHRTLVASVRAGNVVGGGDWGGDRLVPDIMRAAARGERACIRHPESVRPWQHVLEPLAGYLQLGQRLLAGETQYAGPWNFAPPAAGRGAAPETVADVVAALKHHWPAIAYHVAPCDAHAPREARTLRLDAGQARARLGWDTVWTGAETFAKTAAWYREYYENGSLLTTAQLEQYIHDADRAGLPWVKP
jgi:CDP-glucose 4,6-dehydratase